MTALDIMCNTLTGNFIEASISCMGAFTGVIKKRKKKVDIWSIS